MASYHVGNSPDSRSASGYIGAEALGVFTGSFGEVHLFTNFGKAVRARSFTSGR